MNELQSLATRARAGDTRAAAELRSRLQGPLTRIVKRAVTAPPGATSLTRSIQAEAAFDFDPYRSRPSTEGTVGRVARRICHSVLSGLSRSPVGVNETIRV